VNYILVVDLVIIIAVVIYALIVKLAFSEIIPFSLILLVASVPIALPATFTLASSIGAHELIQQGIYITRLPAIQEAAEVDLLCSDKTGTITQNKLVLTETAAFPPFTNDQVLFQAACASDEASQDPLDLAILQALPERAGRLRRTLPDSSPSTLQPAALSQFSSRTVKKYIISKAHRTQSRN